MLRASMLAVLALALTPLSGRAQFGAMTDVLRVGGAAVEIGGGKGGSDVFPSAGLPKEWAVEVEMAGGKSVTGVLSLAGVEIDCDFGRYFIKPEKVESIQFPPPDGEQERTQAGMHIPATVNILDGEPISGAVKFPSEWMVTTDLGILTLDPGKLRTLTFTHETLASTVSGTVLLAGKPIEGEIVFHPERGEAVTAQIEPDGAFHADVPAGAVRVYFRSPGMSETYADPVTTPLQFRVDSFGPNQMDVRLRNPGGMM